MTKSKPVVKKQKAASSKKVSTRSSASLIKPIKLGGVPNQGTV